MNTKRELYFHCVSSNQSKLQSNQQRGIVKWKWMGLDIFIIVFVTRLLINRFFSEDSYLGDKHFLISIFTEAA